MQKGASIERMLEEKSIKVINMQKQRQLEAKLKNEMALARAKANESKIISQKHHWQSERHQVSQQQDIFANPT